MSELHEAASTGDLMRVEDALKRGLSPDEPDIDWAGRTPLHIACAAGHKKCVYVLLKEGADPNAVTEYGWTGAHFACEGGHLSCLQTLISFGCDVLLQDRYGDDPATVAHRHGQLDCLSLLRGEKTKKESVPDNKIKYQFTQ